MKHLQLNLSVLIHKVKLQVRFPCSLLAVLKVQNEEIAFGSEVPLRLGEAYLEISAANRFSIYFDANRNAFSDKKIFICIYLITSSGRIPAGAASINTNSLKKGTSKVNLSIEKCPDKSAFIDASITYQVLNEIQFVQSSEHISDLPLGEEIFTHRKRNSGKVNKTEIFEGDVNGCISPKASQGSAIKKSVEKLDELRGSNAGRSSASYQIDIEHSSFAKRKNEEKSQRQFTTYSPGTGDFTSKIKLSELERQIKTVQKKYEQAVIELKTANSKKDMVERGLKETEGQLKLFKEKNEDSQITLQNLQKRFDYKETSYKDQIKNLTEKLSASQNEKQQMIFEKNDLVTEFEEREKTLRLSMREKEKQSSEERNRLTKKGEQLAKDLAEMQAKSGESQFKLLELTRDSSGLAKQNELLQDKCQTLFSQIEQLKVAHLSQKTKREELEETLGNNLQLEDEKKKLKKKLGEQELQISKHLKNIALLQFNYQKQIKKTEEVEATLRDKTNSFKILQKDHDNLTKQVQTLKKNLDEKQKKIDELSNMKQGESSKVETLSEQLRQLERKSLQQAKALKKDVKQKQLRIQTLCKENEDQAEAINDYNSKIQSMQLELDDLKQVLAKLEHDHEEVLKSKSALEEEIIELQVSLSSEKNSKDEMEKALTNQINDRDTSIRRLQQIIKKFQSNSAHKEEQDAYRISILQQKITNYQNDLKQHQSQIENLKTQIKNLQQVRSQGLSSIEQQEFTIKLKNNEISFLKEAAEKNNQQITQLSCQNKEMSVTIQRLTERQAELQVQLESLSSRLDEAHQNGSGVQQQLKTYIQQNNQKLRGFLNAFLDGSKIQFLPVHQEAEIQALMGSAISKVNQVYSNYEESNKKLQSDLANEQAQTNQLRLEIEGRLHQNEDLRNDLDEALARSHQNGQESDGIIRELKNQLQSQTNQSQTLSSELANLKEVNASLSEELQTINNQLQSKSDENSTLKEHITELQNKVRMQERQYSMTQSRQSSKFEEESATLKTIISSLQDQSKIQSNKYSDLTAKLNDKVKECKQLERKTSEEIKRLSSENDKLNTQVAKQAKEIDAKGSLNSRYSEIETQLRNKLEQAGKDNASLKELNETIRKRNEKAALKEKELQDTITTLKSGQSQLNNKQSDLEKALKERTTEFVASREQNFKLEKEKQKLGQDLEIANALVKVKEENEKKLGGDIKNLESERTTLREKVKALQSSSAENGKKSAKELASLNEAKENCEKQLEQTKGKLQATQSQILGLSKNSQQTNKQLSEQIKELKMKNKELDDKLAVSAKNTAEQEKVRSVEDLYLKPVRDNIQFLRGHMAEYARVGDQFESNKNKLLKMATVKADIPTDKYIGERIRDLSFAYNKLKVFILACQLDQTVKDQAGQEIKRVQVALDRVLRGEK